MTKYFDFFLKKRIISIYYILFKVRARTRAYQKLNYFFINVLGLLASFVFFLYFCSLKYMRNDYRYEEDICRQFYVYSIATYV